jgi:ParB family chromosome partitioning protein
LGSLIPQKKSVISEIKPSSPVLEDGHVRYIETSKISPNPKQPREYFSPEGMEDLAASVKKHGILQPLVVTPLGEDRFELIAGERRLRAAKLVDLKFVPVIIRKIKEHEKLELALIENLQRQDLNAIEEALGYKRLIDEFNLTQDEAGEKVSKSRPAVANALRLLNLPKEIQEAVARGKISASAGRVLAGIGDAKKRDELFKKMLSGLTVRESEEQVREKGMSLHTRHPFKDPALLELAERLRESLHTKVDIKKSGKTGKIIIEFYSEEELKKLKEKLL